LGAVSWVTLYGAYRVHGVHVLPSGG